VLLISQYLYVFDSQIFTADFDTSQTVEFMQNIPEVKPAVGSALVTLGDGNWKMGDGVSVNKSTRLGEGDEDVIIEHFNCEYTYTQTVCYSS
jgi:exocyst complex protein 7